MLHTPKENIHFSVRLFYATTWKAKQIVDTLLVRLFTKLKHSETKFANVAYM